MPQSVRIIRLSGDAVEIARRVSRGFDIEGVIEHVKPIVLDVRRRCMGAVREYSQRFDGVFHDNPIIYSDEVHAYEERLDYKVIEAIEVAASHVKRFSRSIMPSSIDTGVARLEWLPVERVGAYVPGGRNPYPSTAIMTVVPAKVAGSREVFVTTPPLKGRIKADPAVVVASFRSGADGVIALGGPQAIAGMAFGCSPLPKVDMIVGPGGPYVQAAKLLVYGHVGIDMVAGPTELMVIAHPGSKPSHVALEVLAQGEHGRDSLVIVASSDGGLLESVANTVSERVYDGETFATLYLAKVRDMREAFALADMVAPEHLLVYGPLDVMPSSGAISLGVPTPLLDYGLGPSHVLPTGGAARWRGGLSVYDFLRPVAVAHRPGGKDLLEAGKTLARYEGFRLHLESLESLEV